MCRHCHMMVRIVIDNVSSLSQTVRVVIDNVSSLSQTVRVVIDNVSSLSHDGSYCYR